MRLHKLLMSTADISIGSVSILSVGLLVHDQLRLLPPPFVFIIWFLLVLFDSSGLAQTSCSNTTNHLNSDVASKPSGHQRLTYWQIFPRSNNSDGIRLQPAEPVTVKMIITAITQRIRNEVVVSSY